MRSPMLTGVKAALIAGTLMWSVQSIDGRSSQTSVAQHWAQRLQDDARVLRNGSRAGASVAVLAREHDRLRADLEGLVRSHEHWVSGLRDEERAGFAGMIVEMEQGCARIRAHLVDLDEALKAPRLDRRRVQTLGQAIARRAGGCERALRSVRSVDDG